MKFRRYLTLMLAMLFFVVGLMSGCVSGEKPNDDNGDKPTTLHATITMENGDIIELELYYDIAPQTVANFVELARSGYYDGLTFHRVKQGFMIQGGCPDGNGRGNPGYFIEGEFSQNGFENNLAHTEGVISMARSTEYNSAGSQFFIMDGDAPHLDGAYAAFGKVTSGMDVVHAIAETPSADVTFMVIGDQPVIHSIVIREDVELDAFTKYSR